MSLLLKIIRGSENRSAHRRSQAYHREARGTREDPVLYQVKQKLKNHSDPKYRELSGDALSKEAIHLTDPESLKRFFRGLTHMPIISILEEVNSLDNDATESDQSCEDTRQRRLERVGHLTLKLHLSHTSEASSFLASIGAGLLKVPYGVLHAALEIGDTSNPKVSFIVEFNRSNLVQPRMKSLIEESALEATISLRGMKLCRPSSQQQRTGAMTMPRRSRKVVADKYLSTSAKEHTRMHDNLATDNLHPIVRGRSHCLKSSYERPSNLRRLSSIPLRREAVKAIDRLLYISQTDISQSTSTEDSDSAVAASTSASEDSEIESAVPIYHQREQACARTEQTLSTDEDLTEYVQLSLSKVLLVEKLVDLIVKYNKNYYYHSITRNSQTFVVEVLQSFGVWENFNLGRKLKEYANNITKGKKEVYKSHKGLNDRVKYLIVSKEIEETTYDEARYLRSLYTIFHLEEASMSAQSSTTVCSHSDCHLQDIERHLNTIRPEGTTKIHPPGS